MMCDPCGFINRLVYKATDKILNIQGEEVDLDNLHPHAPATENSQLTDSDGPPSREEMARKLNIAFWVVVATNIAGVTICEGLGFSKIGDSDTVDLGLGLILAPIFVVLVEIPIGMAGFCILDCYNNCKNSE